MIGIRAPLVEVRILRRDDAEPARHVEDVHDADLRARIARRLPFGNRRRLVERVDALLDENAHQRAAQALSHRPALERRGRRDVIAVPLRDDAALVGDDERGGHPGRIEGGFDRLLHLGHVDSGGQSAGRQQIAHRPRLRLRVRQRALHDRRREEHVGLADRQRDAPLAADLFGCPDRAIGHRHFDRPLFAVDLRRAELGPLGIWRGEVADILGRKAGSSPVTNTAEHMIFA